MTPLAACLAAAVAADAAEPMHPATSQLVTSCADDGSLGTLRSTVTAANSGDIVDLRGLNCSRITLQTGAIHVDVDGLTLQGPGATALTIDAAHADRAFMHGGSATLSLRGLTITNGKYTSSGAHGGCIYSLGSVQLYQSTVSSCEVGGTVTAAGGGIATVGNLTILSSTVSGNRAYAGLFSAGGGVYAHSGKVTLMDSVVSNNIAQTAEHGFARGGGIYAPLGDLSAKYSTVSGNSASVLGATGQRYVGNGGGLSLGRDDSTGSFLIASCTIDHNHADDGAGIYLTGTSSASATIQNSTISGNVANLMAGGVLNTVKLTLANSTVAFNVAGTYGGGGLVTQIAALHLESSIVADNSPSGVTYAADLDGASTISGHDNLVKLVGASIILPSGTIRLDPQLNTLQDNGGVTRTHALLPGSPAIDAGNNSANLDNDQRGNNFPRKVDAAPDIGAFEFNSDIIFINGFN
jgi:hypothetical protein